MTSLLDRTLDLLQTTINQYRERMSGSSSRNIKKAYLEFQTACSIIQNLSYEAQQVDEAKKSASDLKTLEDQVSAKRKAINKEYRQSVDILQDTLKMYGEIPQEANEAKRVHSICKIIQSGQQSLVEILNSNSTKIQTLLSSNHKLKNENTLLGKQPNENCQ